MTDIEHLLRATIAPEPGSGLGGTEDGWAAIVDVAERRRHRRRLTQRSLLIAIVIGLGMAAAVGAPQLGDGTAVTDTAETIGVGRLEPGPGDRMLAALFSVRTVLVVGLVAAVSVGWPRPRGAPPVSAGARTGRAAVVAALAFAMAFPVWAYGRHLDEIEILAASARSFPDLGLDIVDVDRHRSPFNDADDPLLTVTVAVERNRGEAAAQALAEAGFEPHPVLDHRERLIEDLRTGAFDYRQVIEVNADDGGPVSLRMRTAPAEGLSYLPLTLFFATVLAAMIGILAIAAFRGTAMVRALGTSLMAATGLQAALVLRALWRAKAVIDRHQARYGPIDRDSLFSVGPLGRQPPELVQLVADADGVAAGIYPVGQFALVLLLVPWVIAVALVWPNRRRPLITAIGTALALTAVALVLFTPTNGPLLDLLE